MAIFNCYVTLIKGQAGAASLADGFGDPPFVLVSSRSKSIQ
jgi:hypothetical protein